MSVDPQAAQSAEFGTVAEWTAEVAQTLGPDFYLPAACRGSGNTAALRWLIAELGLRPGEALLDVGAGLGGPSAFAAEQAGVLPMLVEPEMSAVRSATSLFALPAVCADAVALPVRDASVAVAWSLGVLCTPSDEPTQLTMLRELHRVVPAGGRLGLLVFIAAGPTIDDPPAGNRFPTAEGLARLMRWAQLDIQANTRVAMLAEPEVDWVARENRVEDELARRYGHTDQWQTAAQQSDRIGAALRRGQLDAVLIVATPA